MARTSRRPARQRVTLSEEDGVRYLHFGTEWIQGGMRIARPWQLELEYQKRMMALALFLPEPAHILQLGLGAAALTKFCYRHMSTARVTAVERSGEVIDVARQWFALPADNNRLEVVQADAREHLGTLRRSDHADWLQVDLYDAAARGPVHDDAGFYSMCRRALRRPGVACFNLFGGRFDSSFRAIAAAFYDRVLAGPSVDEGNRIVYAFAGPSFDSTVAALDRRAGRLEDAWRMPVTLWLGELLQANDLAGQVRL
ncbi:MAG TPA: spermidine synthase [Burkholderiaceae bacterium]|nr:spermidine synthase [Burkholderiaceae bacterium]